MKANSWRPAAYRGWTWYPAHYEEAPHILRRIRANARRRRERWGQVCNGLAWRVVYYVAGGVCGRSLRVTGARSRSSARRARIYP